MTTPSIGVRQASFHVRQSRQKDGVKLVVMVRLKKEFVPMQALWPVLQEFVQGTLKVLR